MTTGTKKQMQIEELKAFAQELRDHGFTVLVSAKHPFEWLHYYKNGQFGTVAGDYYFSFNFSTVNKPCVECGTGFATGSEVDLTIDNANKSLAIPDWASTIDRTAAKQYTSVDEFINSTNNQWAEYYIY